MNEPNDNARNENDEKWLNARSAHVVGKITVAAEQRENYVEFFGEFGNQHGFSILIDQDRPGPPGTLPSILMTRNDGVQIDTADFLVTRVGFALRQPAPRDEWKNVGEDLLRELVAKFDGQFVIERAVWLPLADWKLVATLWGASRSLNLKSERLFAGTNSEDPNELSQALECMGRPCVLTYQFVNDQLYRVQLEIPDLGSMDYVPVYQTVANVIGRLYGPTFGDTGLVVSASSGEMLIGGQAHAIPHADSMRWEVNYMRVDWSWVPTEDSVQAILEYSHLDHLPKD